MVTDVYLEWDGMTEKDRINPLELDYKDWGKHGYLRASIGMIEENAVLRQLFEEGFYEEDSKLYPCDFIMGRGGMKIINTYLTVIIDKNKQNNGEAIWLKSLLDFFDLGRRLQNEGKNPKISIGWTEI